MNLFPIRIAWFGIEDMTICLLYVVLGMYLSKPLLSCRLNSNVLLAGGSACLLGGIASFFLLPENQAAKLVSCLLLMSAMLSAGTLLAKKDSWIVDALVYFGERAFTVYLYSWPIQIVLELIIVVVLKWSWQSCFVVMFFGGACGPLAIYEIYIRFIPRNKLFDLLIGAK